MSENERSPYIRRVTFLDRAPDNPVHPPVSIVHTVLFDGVDHGEIFAREDRTIRSGWKVFDEGSNSVVVSIDAVAEHVTTKVYTRNGEEVLSGTHICGLPVLTPADYPWEPLPALDGRPGLMRVYFQVREVEILAAKPV